MLVACVNRSVTISGYSQLSSSHFSEHQVETFVSDKTVKAEKVRSNFGPNHGYQHCCVDIQATSPC